MKLDLPIYYRGLLLTVTGAELNALHGSGVTATEFGYVHGLTGPITTLLAGKQDVLVSGTNIKTINSTPLLGSGNMVIGTGGTMVYPGVGIPLSTGIGWSTSITDNSANWNTAYTDRLKWDGGATGLVAATARTSLGGTTAGISLFTLSNPSAITYPRINADNTITALSASALKSALSLTATDISLGNVTNESKATMFTNSTLTGTPTAPTANIGTNNNQIATTGFVIANSGGSSVGTLSTRVDSIVDALKDTTDILTSPKINEDVAMTATSTQLNYVDVNSSIQEQFATINTDLNDNSILTISGLDSLRVLSSEPVTGNIYINSIDKKIHYLSGGYWHRFAILDSVAAKNTYYVSNQGSDDSTGLTPTRAWKTITKVNSYFSSINAGDRILFRSGDSFYGTINVSKAGTAINNIIIGAYGKGAKPIITGFSTISSWTNEGGGIYSKTISCASNPNFITINDKQYAMGRFPNAGTDLIIDSHSTNVSITDAGLNSATTNWTGAETVIRKNEFVMDRCVITNHVSHTLTYTDAAGSDNATDGYPYYIQNDLRTLDQFGEWYYSGTKLYVYFGAATPTSYIVKIPTIDYGVTISAYGISYIIVDGLSFDGYNSYAVYQPNWYTPYNTIKNCYISNTGSHAIYAVSTRSLTVQNNVIINCIGSGVYGHDARNVTIINNTIKNIGIKGNVGLDGSTASNGIDLQGDGPYLVQYNTIDSVAYDGIRFMGSNSQIRNNTISNFCLNLNDGGGIYTTVGIPDIKKVIDGNVIFNGIGKKGISSYDLIVQGIYMDSYTAYTTVINNSVYHCGGYGIMLSNGNHVTIKNNTCFDNASSMYFLEWGAPDAVNNILMTDNIFFAKGATDITLNFDSQLGTVGSFGTSDRNYFARPIDDNLTIKVYELSGGGGTGYKTFAQWKTFSSQDANSNKAPITVDNINKLHFIYNPTNAVQQYTLSALMVDVTNTGFYGTINVNPYTSLVLIGSGTVTFKPTKLIRQ
jgi:parallel beta-helix repeat protein